MLVSNRYIFALQSRRGETQSADSFMRVPWPFGGSLIDAETFEPNLPNPLSRVFSFTKTSCSLCPSAQSTMTDCLAVTTEPEGFEPTSAALVWKA